MTRSLRPVLADMLSHAEEAMDCLGGRDGDALARDRLRFLALTRLVEVVGEAATRVSGDDRARFPAIDFKSAAAMRNRLIHGYDTVSPAILAETVRVDFPPLVQALRNALAALPER